VALHVVDWTGNILNVLHFQHPIDHQCAGRLRQNNRSRSLQESVRCRDRTVKFSRGYLELLQEREKAFKEYRDNNRRPIICLTPAVKVIQAFSGILGEAVTLVSNKYDLVTLLNRLLSAPVPTGERFVCRDRCSPRCTSLEYALHPFPL
jgi:hypothetical protein